MNTTGKPDTPLLDVSDLAVEFRVPSRGGVFYQGSSDVKAVDGVSFSMARGETLGLVGESGCGKSTTGRAVLQLLKPTGGRVVFDDEPIHEFWKKKGQKWVWDHRLLDLRRRMQMIFQDPFASLNPRMTVETILSEPLRNFDVVQGSEQREKIQHLLMTVGMDPRCMRRYPHEFSGGQRQRISIARALATQPRLLVCDEPTSALDVSIQAQILNLLKDLQEQLNLTILFISHDLPVIRQMCERIAVLKNGKICEVSTTEELFIKPTHNYTKELLNLMPKIESIYN